MIKNSLSKGTKYLHNRALNVSMNSATWYQLTSIVLTPGTWIILGGMVYFGGGAGLSMTKYYVSISASAPGYDVDKGECCQNEMNINHLLQTDNKYVPLPGWETPVVVPEGSTKTIYLNANMTHNGGAGPSGSGWLAAMRVDL